MLHTSGHAHTVYIHTNTDNRTHIHTPAHTIPPQKLQFTPLSVTHKHTTHESRQTNNSLPIAFSFQIQFLHFSRFVTTLLPYPANLFFLPPLHELLQNKHHQTQQALETDPCLSPNGGAIPIFLAAALAAGVVALL